SIVFLISGIVDPIYHQLLEFLRLVVVRLVVSKKSKNHVSLHFRQVGFTVPESFMRPWSVMNLIARITEISENQTIPRIFHLQISLQPAIVLHPFCQAIPYQSNPVPGFQFERAPAPASGTTTDKNQ